MSLQELQEIEVAIERVGVNGEGIGYFQGCAIFVEGALPGEVVVARVSEKRKKFARATLVKLLHKSKNRVEPICPLFGRCGGCQLMHLEYGKQLEVKRDRVQDAIERIGKIKGVDVLPCKPSPTVLKYRNKIQMPVKEGILGLYERNSHDIVRVESCMIHCEVGERVLLHCQQILLKYSLPSLRHVLIRSAVQTGQVLVILVTSGENENMLKRVAAELMSQLPEIKGVVHNIHRGSDNTILGDEYHTLEGQGFIEERLCSKIFTMSPASFFQVNPLQAEAMYLQVKEWAACEGDEVVVDAYCGVGTLSLIMAPFVKEVIGIECVAAAIENAKENARVNGIENVKFYCALAEEFMMKISKMDVAIINPPRKGCDKSFLDRLIEIKPYRIIYVSCDPATLARDLQVLVHGGYVLKQVQPFDMFPQTSHVESVVLLELIN